jgi:hypothetical protein
MKQFQSMTDARQFVLFERAYGRKVGPFCGLLADEDGPVAFVTQDGEQFAGLMTSSLYLRRNAA